jgi:hypothetical protein
MRLRIRIYGLGWALWLWLLVFFPGRIGAGLDWIGLDWDGMGWLESGARDGVGPSFVVSAEPHLYSVHISD